METPSVILAIVSAKGGVGKTTTAIHLAALLAETGTVVLVDDDPNQSSTRYAERARDHQRPLPFTVTTTEGRGQVDWQHLVIDTPARADPADVVALARAADHLIVPATPDPLSLDAALETAQLVAAARSWGLLLTICPSSPEHDADDARASLVAAGLRLHRAQIRKAKAFQHAALVGGLVWQQTSPRAHLAAGDYRQLASELPRGVGA